MAEFDASFYNNLKAGLIFLAESAVKTGNTEVMKHLIEIAFLDAQALALEHAVHDELSLVRMNERAGVLLGKAKVILGEHVHV